MYPWQLDPKLAPAIWDGSQLVRYYGKAGGFPRVRAQSNAVAARDVERGIALCGSGVGASVAAHKICGVRAGLIHDVFSAHQVVEDDDMNGFCLHGNVIGSGLALELVERFLCARFSGAPRRERRIAEVRALEVMR